MKNRYLTLLCFLFLANLSVAQEWMTNLDIAQKLALVQNKMVLMVWEGTTEYPYPVFVNDDKGRRIFIEDLYTDQDVSPLIWKNFVPVIVDEEQYGILYSKIKGKRSQKYIDKFNDNSIKIMDVNGNILNVDDVYYEELQNISKIIQKYAFNTEFITPELTGYQTEKTFYGAYYLASRYMDFSLYTNEKLRPEIIELSSIYIDEARMLAKSEPKEEQFVLNQRCDLLEIQQLLLVKRPKRVLRFLKKMDAEGIDNANAELVAFLYYTAHMSLDDREEAEVWKSKISSVNLKKAEMLINLNS